MELQWKRQAEADAVLAGVPAALTAGGVLEVAGLAHLERILEEATGQLVVLTVYSRSCGICKEVVRELEGICHESRQQRARIVFLTHDMNDEFDWPSDLARMYKLRSAPRFLFFIDGAMVRSAGIADSRRIAHGSRRQVEAALHAEHRRLRDTLWELLVKNAPSARR
ncbi:thioredoxin-like chloroplastic [Micractinium conductrix]|uniref:Thioredoxin-like chloroplastic n=1 Tax=Micractinium conductrix TaxID=554055 RepID=A0A2P6VCA9_9CHLO|nr:thioredoxin-like chloroplastic [Micractinium conductrix]|eukprot:PSC71718.1 thioredoxin-like chloroplastic [Micractinium conductrix]